MKKLNLLVLPILLGFLLFMPAKKVQADSPFLTIDSFDAAFTILTNDFQTQLASLQSDLQTQIDLIESRIDTFEPSVVYNSNHIAELEQRVDYLEPIVATFDPNDISYLESLISDQAQQIEDLKDEIASLAARVSEADGNPPGVEPVTGFFNGEEPIDTYGYNNLSVTIIGSEDVYSLDVYYSDDKITWTHQHDLGDGADGYQPSYFMPVLGRYYKLVNTGDWMRVISYYLE